MAKTELAVDLDRNTILNSITRIIAEKMDRNPTELRPEMLLIEDISCDSLDIVEISMELEEHFETSIPDEFAEHVGTINKVTDDVISLLRCRTDDL